MHVRGTHLQSLLHVIERAIDSYIKESSTDLRELFESRPGEPLWDVFYFRLDC